MKIFFYSVYIFKTISIKLQTDHTCNTTCHSFKNLMLSFYIIIVSKHKIIRLITETQQYELLSIANNVLYICLMFYIYV